jgi:hypothetical protein
VWEWNNRHALQGRALSTEAGRKENTEESMLKLPLHFFHDRFRRPLEWATIPLNPFLCLRAVIWCVLKTALEPSGHRAQLAEPHDSFGKVRTRIIHFGYYISMKSFRQSCWSCVFSATDSLTSRSGNGSRNLY